MKRSVREDPFAKGSKKPAKKAPAKKAAPAPAAFEGFPKGGHAFFKELAKNQDRDWFAENKERYVELWHEPMTALFAAFQAKAAKVFPGIGDVEAKIFRIHRDTRFSPDKTPYKTHAAGMIPIRKAKRIGEPVSAIYLQAGLDGDMAAAGQWMLEPVYVEKMRKGIADDKRGAAVQKLVDAAVKRGFSLHSHDALKRVPAPYPQDHPRGDLLKRKGLALGFPEIPKGMLHKADLVDWFVDQAKEIAPILRWLDEVVAPAK